MTEKARRPSYRSRLQVRTQQQAPPRPHNKHSLPAPHLALTSTVTLSAIHCTLTHRHTHTHLQRPNCGLARQSFQGALDVLCLAVGTPFVTSKPVSRLPLKLPPTLDKATARLAQLAHSTLAETTRLFDPPAALSAPPRSFTLSLCRPPSWHNSRTYPKLRFLAHARLTAAQNSDVHQGLLAHHDL